MIEIKAQAKSEPILADYVKDYLHWSDFDSSAERILDDYISAARELLESVLNLSFVEKTYRQWFERQDLVDGEIELFYPPHQEIKKVVKVDKDGTETDLVEGDGYYIFKGLTWHLKLENSGERFYCDFVSYYSSLPVIFRMAIAELVGNWYEGEVEVGELSQAVKQKISRFSKNTLV